MTNQWIQTYPSFRQTCIIYIYIHIYIYIYTHIYIYAYNGLLTYLSYIYTDISQMPISSSMCYNVISCTFPFPSVSSEARTVADLGFVGILCDAYLDRWADGIR